jgi:hypothetical protein
MLVAITTQSDLDEIAADVRNKIELARMAWSNAVRHAMNAGDLLIAVQPKVSARGVPWKKWLKEYCSVAVSTAELYMRLARHRDQIETELQAKGQLSLRGARQLISTARRDEDADNDSDQAGAADESENPPESETLVEHWRRSPGELAALLDAVGVTGILEAMSEEFGRLLRARLPAPKRKSDKPYKHTLNLEANSARNGRGTHSRH